MTRQAKAQDKVALSKRGLVRRDVRLELNADELAKWDDAVHRHGTGPKAIKALLGSEEKLAAVLLMLKRASTD